LDAVAQGRDGRRVNDCRTPPEGDEVFDDPDVAPDAVEVEVAILP
jgi:hypothetical protein